MIPKEVFHYTKTNIAIEYIFWTKKIRFSQFKSVNDPWESKDHQVLNTDGGWNIDIYKEIMRVRTEEWRVLCLSQNCSDYIREDNQSQRGDCRPRMWASYAENHKGLCLRFDGNKINEKIQKNLGEKGEILHGAVSYCDEKLMKPKSIDKKINTTEGIREHIRQNWVENFLVKSKDWETECEYRWIIHSTDDKSDFFVPVEEALTGVMIGADFPKAYASNVVEFCKDQNIQIGKIRWVNGLPLAEYHDPYERYYLR